ncbi:MULTISPECIES: hypothetical protein [Aeromonas]|jgi:hypothetical protein|uniref:Uncharacterized protein n=1 Tax=Aeromonas veronii TaxID=654 RepID=A0A2T4N0H5_AERVE|nr:hypothetical protein [Aeromonas veronii]AXV20746.1 hypothetical protein C7U63_12640 [Aeromonas veronii]MBA2800288.1 hypothetical protein [Aeromonas veronii]MCX0443710.1 hypothetical protein [Aeromonas veronii]PTH80314.1 hypothetical protein DAA48_15230 [Aeromonas veronii]RDE61857.1 hypothetical protein DV708_14570 [Aeromonas veronii]
MTRRYGILALAILTLLLVNLGWQEEPSPISPERSTTPSLADMQLPTEPGSPPPRMPNAEGMDGKSKEVPSSWQAMPDELINQLASEISDSELPLAQRVSNLEATEAGWLSEGESLIRLQGRYALALDQLAQESEQLPLAERLDALSRLQDRWAADHPDLAVDLFNPDARLQQARQLWGDEELATLARHFLPSEQAEATLVFAGARQQQLAQRSRYQRELAELEQQLAASQQQMDPALWQQHKEEVLSQWRRDFFAREQGKP